MAKTKEQDFRIMSILNVTEISRVICDTNMGILKLRIRKGEKEYKFVLDAVELPKELNAELMEAIYPQVIGVSVPIAISSTTAEVIFKDHNKGKEITIIKSKGRGRPAGAKNKVKDNGKTH